MKYKRNPTCFRPHPRSFARGPVLIGLEIRDVDLSLYPTIHERHVIGVVGVDFVDGACMEPLPGLVGWWVYRGLYV